MIMIGIGLCLISCVCLRYVKVFTKKSRDSAMWLIGVAHPRLDKDPSLNIIPIKLVGNQDTQQFTKMTARSWYGRKATIAAQCTVIPWSSFSDEVKESLRDRFQPLLDKGVTQAEDLEGGEDEEAGEIVQSQTYPQYGQSQNQNTLKSCSLCDFATRSEDGLKEHEKEEHPNCEECGQKMKNQVDLEAHIERMHVTFKCALCGKSVQVEESVAHMNMHNTQDSYRRVITEGSKKSNMLGYYLFLKEKKAELRIVNPGIRHQMATSQISVMWKGLSKKQKNAYEVRAVQDQGEEVDAAVQHQAVILRPRGGALADPPLVDPPLADPLLANPLLADPLLADPLLAGGASGEHLEDVVDRPGGEDLEDVVDRASGNEQDDVVGGAIGGTDDVEHQQEDLGKLLGAVPKARRHEAEPVIKAFKCSSVFLDNLTDVNLSLRVVIFSG